MEWTRDVHVWLVTGTIACLLVVLIGLRRNALGLVGIHPDGLLLRDRARQPVLVRWERIDGLALEEARTQQQAVPGSHEGGGLLYDRRLTISARGRFGVPSHFCIAFHQPAHWLDREGPFGDTSRQTTIAADRLPYSRLPAAQYEQMLRTIEGIRDAIVAKANLRATGAPRTRLQWLPDGRSYGAFPSLTWTTQMWEPSPEAAVAHDARSALVARPATAPEAAPIPAAAPITETAQAAAAAAITVAVEATPMPAAAQATPASAAADAAELVQGTAGDGVAQTTAVAQTDAPMDEGTDTDARAAEPVPSSVPSFDECEAVYASDWIAPEDRPLLLLPWALVVPPTVVELAGSCDALDTPAISVALWCASFLVGLALLLRGAENRIGIHRDGLLIRLGARRPIFVPWELITGLWQATGELRDAAPRSTACPLTPRRLELVIRIVREDASPGSVRVTELRPTERRLRACPSPYPGSGTTITWQPDLTLSDPEARCGDPRLVLEKIRDTVITRAGLQRGAARPSRVVALYDKIELWTCPSITWRVQEWCRTPQVADGAVCAPGGAHPADDGDACAALAGSATATLAHGERRYSIGRGGQTALAVLSAVIWFVRLAPLIVVFPPWGERADLHVLLALALACPVTLAIICSTVDRLRREHEIGVSEEGLRVRKWPWRRVLIPWERITGLAQEDREPERPPAASSGRLGEIGRSRRLTIRTRGENGRDDCVRISAGPRLPGWADRIGPFGERTVSIAIAQEQSPAVDDTDVDWESGLRTVEEIRDGIVTRAGLSELEQACTRSDALGDVTRARSFPSIDWRVRIWGRASSTDAPPRTESPARRTIRLPDGCEWVWAVSRGGGGVLRGVSLVGGYTAGIALYMMCVQMPDGIGPFVIGCYQLALGLAFLAAAAGVSRRRRQNLVGVHPDGLVLRKWPWRSILIPWEQITDLRCESGTLRHASPRTGETRQVAVNNRLAIRAERKKGRSRYFTLALLPSRWWGNPLGAFGRRSRHVSMAWEDALMPGDYDARVRAVADAQEQLRVAIVDRAGLHAAEESTTRTETLRYDIWRRVRPSIFWTVQAWKRPQSPASPDDEPSGGAHQGQTT